MGDILDAFGAAGGEELPQVIRLGRNPVVLMFFTRESDSARLHWESDGTVKGHVPCPGAYCPLCHVAEVPTEYQLLPALVIDTKRVGVLMVSLVRGPTSLAAQLVPHLRCDKIEAKLFLVSRADWKYSVEVRPIGERTDRCASVIQAFVEARDAGLSLLTAFPKLSAVDLAEVARVRAKLDALGGWTSPGA